mgnify:CR=1 FL=1
MGGPAVALRAGAARIDISPPIGVQLFGYPHARRISTGVHDPLWASALVLKSGGAQCALVALDLLFLDPPTARRIRRRVAAALGVQDSAVFISCSHTHSGPVTSFLAGWAGDIAMPAPDPEFLERVSEAVVHSACEASSSMRPASLAWTAARVEGVGCNRCDPTGPSDPEVGTLAVRGQEGGIISIVMVYGMHPTVLHEDCTLVSSDFPHYARIELEERFGGSMVALYHTGPAGDQSPRYHVKSQTFAEAERLGRRLGAAVANAVAAIPLGSYRSEPLIECRLAAFDPRAGHGPRPDHDRVTLDQQRGELVELGDGRLVVGVGEPDHTARRDRNRLADAFRCGVPQSVRHAHQGGGDGDRPDREVCHGGGVRQRSL